MSEVETFVHEGKPFIVIDKRKEGFYCIYCENFSKDVEMDERGEGLNLKEDGSTLIFKKDPELGTKD